MRPITTGLASCGKLSDFQCLAILAAGVLIDDDGKVERELRGRGLRASRRPAADRQTGMSGLPGVVFEGLVRLLRARLEGVGEAAYFVRGSLVINFLP